MFPSSSHSLHDIDVENVESIDQIVGVNFDSLGLVSECEDSGFLFAEMLQKMDGHDSESESVISVGETESVASVDISDESDTDPMEKYFLRNREIKVNAGKRKQDDKVIHSSKKSKIDQTSQPSSTTESFPSTIGAPMILVHTDPENFLPVNSSSRSLLMPRNGSKEQLLSNGRRKCMTKNAVMARENRLRKKQQFNELELCIEQLREEKDQMKSQVSEQSQKMKAMQKEIEYLRSVIANETGLSALLKSIHSTGLQFGTPLNRPNTAEIERDSHVQEHIPCDQMEKVVHNGNSKSLKKRDDRTTSVGSVHQQSDGQGADRSIIDTKSSGGVCLNVSNNVISVEFCANCSSKSFDQVAGEELITMPVTEHTNRVVTDHSYGKS